MKKIPPGSEASNILVGEVGFLNHQIVAFVRLSKATILGDITEVPVPTRFIFILLGPIGNQNKFHEIGRSIATLMSDQVRTWFVLLDSIKSLCHYKTLASFIGGVLAPLSPCLETASMDVFVVQELCSWNSCPSTCVAFLAHNECYSDLQQGSNRKSTSV